MSHSNKRFIELSIIFKSIAHPDRLAIIQLMCRCQRMTVKNIYEKLQLEQPIVSRHLSIMRNSGFLKREQERNNTYYSLSKENETVSSVIKSFELFF